METAERREEINNKSFLKVGGGGGGDGGGGGKWGERIGWGYGGGWLQAENN